jgi:hypothetical protein
VHAPQRVRAQLDGESVEVLPLWVAVHQQHDGAVARCLCLRGRKQTSATSERSWIAGMLCGIHAQAGCQFVDMQSSFQLALAQLPVVLWSRNVWTFTRFVGETQAVREHLPIVGRDSGAADLPHGALLYHQQPGIQSLSGKRWGLTCLKITFVELL